MATQVESIYEHGILRPLSPLDLEEGQRVIVSVKIMEPIREWASRQLDSLGPAPGLHVLLHATDEFKGALSDVVDEDRGAR